MVETHKVAAADLIEAANKLDGVADEMERTGSQVGGAAAAAVAANFGFQSATQAGAMCGEIKTSVDKTVAEIRSQATKLRSAAASYQEEERIANNVQARR